MGAPGQRVRWVQVEGLHVTLRFLGPTRADLVTAAGEAVSQAAAVVPQPFEVRLAGAGGFPDALRPRALWLGIRSGAEPLGRLAAALESTLGAAGWALESRAFRPHLTIARTDGVGAGSDAAQRLIAAAEELDLAFDIDRIVLYRSHLGRGPARYEALGEAVLGR